MCRQCTGIPGPADETTPDPVGTLVHCIKVRNHLGIVEGRYCTRRLNEDAAVTVMMAEGYLLASTRKHAGMSCRCGSVSGRRCMLGSAGGQRTARGTGSCGPSRPTSILRAVSTGRWLARTRRSAGRTRTRPVHESSLRGPLLGGVGRLIIGKTKA